MEQKCYEIFKKCFPELTCDFDNFSKLCRARERKELYRYVGDTLVGFLYYHRNKISILCVDPAYQNNGYGSSLLEEAENEIKKGDYKDIVLGRSKILLAAVCTKEEYYERKGARFFKRRGYTSLGYCEDMSMDLSTFDITKTKYSSEIPGIEFGFYKGDKKDLLDAVRKVDKGWLEIYECDDMVPYVATKDGKVVSFCTIGDSDVTKLSNCDTIVANIGCVGTVPEMRKKGIGLTLVAKATEILKNKNVNIGHIHYTGVAPWYRKLGYETYIYYWFAHKKISN